MTKEQLAEHTEAELITGAHLAVQSNAWEYVRMYVEELYRRSEVRPQPSRILSHTYGFGAVGTPNFERGAK